MRNSRMLNNSLLAATLNTTGKFYNIPTLREVSETVALQQFTGTRNVVPNNEFRPPAELTEYIDAIINTSLGCYPITGPNTNLLSRINEILTNTTGDQRSINAAENFAKIYYSSTNTTTPYSSLSNIAFPLIGRMIGRNNPTPTTPWLKCSVILINNANISPANKNTDLLTLFLNGIPTIEFSRAVPFVDIRFRSSRSALDGDGRLNALSLYKILEGAVRSSGVGSALVAANTTIPNASRASTVLPIHEAGVELFSTPTALINMNTNREVDSQLRRGHSVLDPTRPMLSFKGLTIDVQPSVGLFSFKTGKAEFILHDSSRLGEIADFIRPDLYSNTELLLEYGWSHPDNPLTSENPFAILLNCTKTIEKFMIRNVSLTFDEQNQVNITLDIAMKGGTDIESELISTATERSVNAIRRIEQIAAMISQYRQRVFRGGTSQQFSGQRTREIRGTQILDAAQDFSNNIRITPELSRALSEFQTSLQRSIQSSEASSDIRNSAQSLSAALSNLYGQRTRGERTQGATEELSTSVQTEIREKLDEMLRSTSEDPMLPTNMQIPDRDGRLVSALRPRAEQSGRRTEGVARGGAISTVPQINANYQGRQRFVSLAKLLTQFVSIPLAATGKYDEVQLLFYPFNESAGFANRINIGQFIVDVNFFFENFVRYRLENISRSAGVNLKDFMSFVASTIIDDPAAAPYGIDNLYEQVTNRETGQTQLRTRYNAVEFQTRLENRLRSRTPNGEFKMPQITCYIESQPARVGIDSPSDTSKTILRLHIFDKQNSAYMGQGAILAASRNTTLNSIASIPNATDGEPGIHESRQQLYASIIERARHDNGLITNIGTPAEPLFVINKGPEEIKKFIMKTMPYIIKGVQGSAVKTANMTSMQNAELSTVNMLRSFRAGPIRANNEQPGGLPLSIIPCELSLNTIGCNLFEFGQQFFVDMNTGTTADNIYGVNGISHRIEPGNFSSDVKLVPLDAYGRYSSFIERINQASTYLSFLSSQ